LKKYCLITNDVETTSLWNHRLSDKTGETVWKEGMPLLLDIYNKYDVKATFYFNGDIVRLYPEVVNMIIPYGHEVASHGWVHESDQAFDVLHYEAQVKHLKQSKEQLEDISQQRVISFRAPALRVNEYTPQALADTGFLTDSSVASQRIDMFLSFGAGKKLKWLTAPRTSYFTSPNDLSRPGNSPIFEIPVNSFSCLMLVQSCVSHPPLPGLCAPA
jgi:peptidoglycan-N-acetylglucosamine deacetylase